VEERPLRPPTRVPTSEPEIDRAALTAVSAPALVLQGDRDEVTPEHGAAVAAAAGDGRLAEGRSSTLSLTTRSLLR